MGLFSYVNFTHLLRDGSREGLGRYAEAVASAVAAWDGIDVAEMKFRPPDPLKWWCPPVESGARAPDSRSVECRFAASDTVRRWDLSLERAAPPRVFGALFPDYPNDPLLDEAADCPSPSACHSSACARNCPRCAMATISGELFFIA